MRRGFAITLLFLLVGCAGVNYQNEKPNAKGIRYYRSTPYLLVYTDNDGGLKTELIYLPDTKHVMTAYPYSLLASNNSVFTFEGGVLRSGESEVDETVVPMAVLSALEKVATASISAFRKNNLDKTGLVPAPRLYRIAWRGGSAYLIGPDGPVDPGSTTDIRVQGKKEEEQEDNSTQQSPAKPAPPKPPAAPGGGGR